MAIDYQAALDSVPFRVTNRERIPARRYYDEAFFNLEKEKLWPHVWQMACRLEEIPEVGDFVEYKILDKSVILVQTKSGVKAFHNSCRHRGVQLVSGEGNCSLKGFVCPFHGWRFNMDGENTFVYARDLFSDEQLEDADLNLVPCRVEFWGGCAFINFDDNAPPLAECLKPVADALDPRNVDKLKVEWWVSTVLPTNWKTAMEAFMEGYHVMRTHPQLQDVTPRGMMPYGGDLDEGPPPVFRNHKERIENAIEFMKRLSDGMAGMCHANDIAVMNAIKDEVVLPDDPAEAMMEWYRIVNAEITARARARGVPMPDLNELDAKGYTAPVQFVFPHYFLLPTYGNMSSYRIRPLTAETCLFELWSLVLYPEDEKRPRPETPVPMAYDDPRFPEIPQQDYSNLPLQQLGLHAKGFEFMRLSRRVEGQISNYQRLIDGYLAGLPQDQLLRATQVAAGAFDVPIADIGF